MFHRRQKSTGPGGQVRMLEVPDQVEAVPLRDAARDVGVGGEVGVDLDRKREHARPQHEEVRRSCSANTLFAITPTLSAMTSFLKKPHTISTVASRAAAAENRRSPLDLRQQVGRAHDRTGHQVREERDERRDVDEPRPRRRVAAIHVDRVAHRLEGVERDAGRQRQRASAIGGMFQPSAAPAAATLSTKKSKYL